MRYRIVDPGACALVSLPTPRRKLSPVSARTTNVATHPIADYRDPLDLLHRFVPAPLTACLHLDCANVILQTNDVRFLPSTEPQDFPDAARMDHQPPRCCVWKIIRDTDVAQELAEATTILSDDLVVYS